MGIPNTCLVGVRRFWNGRFCYLSYADAFHRAPDCVKRISIYSSFYIENFTQTSDLRPKEGCESGFLLDPRGMGRVVL